MQKLHFKIVMGSDEEDEYLCRICGESPCSWIQVQDTMEDHAGHLSNTGENRHLRKAMYRLYVYHEYGFL